MKRIICAVFTCLFIAFAGADAYAACTANQIDVKGDGTQCEVSKFELTTTNLSANDSFHFSMSAKGTFYVDCGDGGTLSGTNASGKKISKSTNVNVQYTCEWATAGAHTIKFGGIATEYANAATDISSTMAALSFGDLLTGNAAKIASISGSLASLFPQLGTSANQIPQFTNTFKEATNLTSIPGTLFNGLSGGSNAGYMFYSTFTNCTGLTAIPEGLFSTITTPADSMFSQTFEGCTSLSGYVPPSAFAGLINNNSPTATALWYDTFEDTQLATTCPAGIPQYTTGYEGTSNSSSWNGVVSCGCPSGYTLSNGTCAVCENPGFTITTTSLAANSDFLFNMSPKGNFVVDWGDGTVENIIRTDTTDTEYSHTYTIGGVKTIKFCGLATEYNSATGDNVVAAIAFYKATGGTQTKIARVSGSLGAVFPTIGNGTAPDLQPRFRSTFQGANNLTTIPANLFNGVFGSADGMFRSTFDKCSKLESIPEGLFAAAYGGAPHMFRSTFYQCTTLKALPENLFAGITKAANYEFKYTFFGTSGLTTYIPASTFQGLIDAGSPIATGMWNQTFDSSGFLSSCPERTTQVITGYEGNVDDTTWKGKVACELSNPCTGATYYDSTLEECLPCPTGYVFDTSAAKELITQCQIQCSAGTYLATANDSACTNVGDGYYAGSSIVNYGSVSSRTRCPDNMPTNTDTATDESQCVVYCRNTKYRDATTNTCVDCPGGYTYNTADGKTSASDCQIHCSAGTYLATANDSTCSDVGDGYWVGESTVNYGGTGTRNQCPDGQLTGTLNATSASQCIALCNGATYKDSNTGGCVPCPVGYNYHTLSGKTSISQCQIHCLAGTYIANANDTICTNVGEGYYAAAADVNYGSAGTRSQCPAGQSTGSSTATDITQCKTSCLGATYYDSTQDSCVACPTGYTDNTADGKSSVTQCQKHCAAGTYTETYTPLLYLQGNGTTLYIDTLYEITSTHVHGTGVVGTPTTVSGTGSDTGNFFGNIYGPGGFSSNYKKGVFGVWMQPVSGSGKKAEYNTTFTADTPYTIDFDVSISGTTTTAQLSVNNSTPPKTASLSKSPINDSGNTFKLFSNGAASKTVNGNVTITYGDKLFSGRIYSLELYDGNTKVLDLIPVRRESDGALGMYNRLNHEFYGNSGTGNFTAGADNGDPFVVCSPVGNKYYVGANDTNYGSNGTRNLCPNSASTIVNNKIITNADSIYKCEGVDPCTGATYPNLTTGVCTLCPTGYDFNTANGKESVSQCQIHCLGGTYLATTYASSCTEVGDGYYADATTINYGDVGMRNRCSNGGTTGTQTATEESACQAIITCEGATYLDMGMCVPCPTGYDYDTTSGKQTVSACQLNCAGGTYLAVANDSACTDAGAGYWSVGGTVNYGSTLPRNACSTGLTTVGYGHGADELSDCGRILHVGDYILYSKTVKPTTPALNIQVDNGATYYLGAGTTNHSLSTLHLSHENQQYTIFDDSLLFGERDFLTNTRVQ